MDIWLSMNPSCRDYCSSVHNSYHRTDYLLLDAKSMPFTTNAKYDSIGISEHSLLTFSLHFDNNTTPCRTWRLHPQLLAENEFCDYLRTQINLYFQTNHTPEPTPAELWEAFKAFVKGLCDIIQGCRKKKE